jgi:hypothetical protein
MMLNRTSTEDSAMSNPPFMLFLVLVYTLAAVWDGSAAQLFM